MNFRPAYLLYEYLHLMQFDIHKSMMHNKLKHVAPKISGKWLDIGAGDQPYKKFFSSADAYLTTNTRRHYSTKEFERLENRTNYWIEDGKSLPVQDQFLDGVACFQVLSVIDKPDEFFREMHRVLKKDGNLLITTDFLYPVWSSEDRYRHTAFNLRHMTEGSGFKVESISSFGGFGSSVYALFMRYMRSYPELWRKKKIGIRLATILPYLLMLMILPIISLSGLLIYFFERNIDSNTDFTFNLFLKAVKK